MRKPKSTAFEFILRRPDRPATLPTTRPVSKLGSNYDTSWSRRYPIRMVRALVVDSLMRPAVELAAKPKIENLDRIESVVGPVIFAVNHSSHLDTAVMVSTLPDRFRHRCVVGAGADYFFDRRWKAVLWSGLLSAIPIERNKAGRRSAELASNLISQGWNLLIFPEGGRTPDGLGQEFRGGVALLAIRCQVPIVPIYLEGTYDILNKNNKRFRPGNVTVSYGTPIHPKADQEARELTAELQAAIDRLADELHSDFLTAARNSYASTTPRLNPPKRGWIELWNRSGTTRSSGGGKRWPAKLIQR